MSFHRNIMWSSISILVQNIIQQKFDNNVSMFYWNQYCYQKLWFNILLSFFWKNLDLNFDYLCVFPMWMHLGFFLFILRFLKFHDGVSHPVFLQSSYMTFGESLSLKTSIFLQIWELTFSILLLYFFLF